MMLFPSPNEQVQSLCLPIKRVEENSILLLCHFEKRSIDNSEKEKEPR